MNVGDMVAGYRTAPCDGGADEARNAGNEDFHARAPSRSMGPRTRLENASTYCIANRKNRDYFGLLARASSQTDGKWNPLE
jgi:hypothetical protein